MPPSPLLLESSGEHPGAVTPLPVIWWPAHGLLRCWQSSLHCRVCRQLHPPDLGHGDLPLAAMHRLLPSLWLLPSINPCLVFRMAAATASSSVNVLAAAAPPAVHKPRSGRPPHPNPVPAPLCRQAFLAHVVCSRSRFSALGCCWLAGSSTSWPAPPAPPPPQLRTR